MATTTDPLSALRSTDPQLAAMLDREAERQDSTLEFIASEKLRDGAGVTLLTEGFIASTGKGRIVQQSQPLQPYKVRGEFNNIRWDNHLTSIHRT